jgi:hypothetical protein
VYWDPVRQQFAGDVEANELVKAKYREPWKLPVL